MELEVICFVNLVYCKLSCPGIIQSCFAGIHPEVIDNGAHDET